MILSRYPTSKALYHRIQVQAYHSYHSCYSIVQPATTKKFSSGPFYTNSSTVRVRDAVQSAIGIMRSPNSAASSKRLSSSNAIPRPKVLFFGTGSIGTCYAFILSRAGCHITAVCRSNFEAVKADGLTVESTIWGTHPFKPDVVMSSLDDIQETTSSLTYDYVLVTAKSFPRSKPTQASLISSAVKKGHTTIALLQNGIDIEAEYSQLYPENPLLSCVVYLPATQTSPAHVQHKEVEHVHVGTYPSGAAPTHKRTAEHLVELMKAGGATATLHDVSGSPIGYLPSVQIPRDKIASTGPTQRTSADGSFRMSKPSAGRSSWLMQPGTPCVR